MPGVLCTLLIFSLPSKTHINNGGNANTSPTDRCYRIKTNYLITVTDMFEVINLLEPWMFFVSAILLVAAGVMLGEVTIIPWLSVAIFVTGIADFLHLSVQSQLIVFCVVFFASVYLSHRYISLAGKQPLIAEGIADMVGQKVTVSQVDTNKSGVGSALSENGKVWNVRHAKNKTLQLDRSYMCAAVSGITLIVTEVLTEKNS
ncbi:MAG: hypothetical protein NZ811_08300 [Gammaproteobacteria bacterium]|nr:hypothetical protein [Gammaproteobacteria bacterium]